MSETPNSFASSTGHELASGDWLDIHFEANRPEYEAQFKAVGIQPGWYVLDAACGSGSYLPWLADLTGSHGRIASLDLAPENVALIEQRVAGWGLPCPVEARVGNVLALPYPDDVFDAVWFANTTQYMTDEELEVALAELRRVVRPGGLVAIKESDGTMIRVLPAPPGLGLRLVQAAANSGNVRLAGCLRAPSLPGWLRRAGLVEVWGRTTVIERTAPLDAVARRFWHDALTHFATLTEDLDLPAADQDVWTQLGDPARLECFLDDPECSIIEGNFLTIGAVPGG